MVGIAVNSCEGKYGDSLDVRFTKACDNSCDFCIEKSGLASLGATDVPALVQATLMSGKSSVLILGGEPLLLIDKVLEYVTEIRNSVQNIFLTTSLPFTIRKKVDIFWRLLSHLDGINVSLQHYDWHRNNLILKATHNFNRMTLLAELCENQEFQAKARISLNLVKGGIDTKAELDTGLSWLQSIGVNHVKINELQNCPELYINFHNLTGLGHAEPFFEGCQYEDLEYYPGLRVTIKQSCFLVEKSLTPSLMELAKYSHLRNTGSNTRSHVESQDCHVLYENGELKSGWGI